jgi:DNA polymerase-3 subunit epsilon
MICAFVDTETTGLPKSGDPKQEGQARVCQLAVLLTDDNGKALNEMCFLIRPDGWTISEGAAKIHGITTEIAEKHGINAVTAYKLFVAQVRQADIIVAHNVAFDKRLMEIEAAYLKEVVVDKPWHCTMEQTRDLCAIPPTDNMIAAGRTECFKSPKLEEAYRIICRRSLGNNAHNAMADVRACRDIFFALKNKSYQTKYPIDFVLLACANDDAGLEDAKRYIMESKLTNDDVRLLRSGTEIIVKTKREVTLGAR